MVDQVPQSKQEEQYPLLKVEGGEGDGGYPQNSSTVIAPAWGVSCQPKHSWIIRLPEFFSACWMTLILVGISFLIFYTLGVSAYRRQPIIVIKCNNTRPASDVYYHQVIQRGAYVPFSLYSDYVSAMATQYPSLRFKIIFLVNDSLPSSFHMARQNRFINKFIPYNNAYKVRLEERNRRELDDFQMKHPNVNISFIPLSKFMATTPLKYKWETIPTAYLPFYARVFSIWQTGGIGADLNTFNDQFNNRQCVDKKVSAIMTQHNDGIKPEIYANSLNTIELEEEREESEFFAVFYTIFHQILNETRSFLNRSLSFSQMTTERTFTINAPLTRIHRAKRELSKIGTESNVSSVNMEYENLTYQSVYNITASNLNEIPKIIQLEQINMSTSNELKDAPETMMMDAQSSYTSAMNKSSLPQMVLFYDFSIISDGLGPSYILPEVAMRSEGMNASKNVGAPQPAKHYKQASHILSMHPEGIFMAASSRMHPLLGQILASGCQRMHPKFAIQDALLTQCSGSFKDLLKDTYCNNIYVL